MSSVADQGQAYGGKDQHAGTPTATKCRHFQTRILFELATQAVIVGPSRYNGCQLSTGSYDETGIELPDCLPKHKVRLGRQAARLAPLSMGYRRNQNIM